MAENEREKAVDQASAPSAAEVPTETRSKKVLYAVGGLMIPLLGTAVGAFFQEGNWNHQNSVTQITQDAQKALETGSNVTGLTDERYSAAVAVIKAARDKATGDAWKMAMDRFSSANKQWEIHFTDTSSQLQFYVDAPFGLRGGI